MTPGESSATTTSLMVSSEASSPTVMPVPHPITNARSAGSASNAGNEAAKPMVG